MVYPGIRAKGVLHRTEFLSAQQEALAFLTNTFALAVSCVTATAKTR